jgi:hypothetical protein
MYCWLAVKVGAVVGCCVGEFDGVSVGVGLKVGDAEEIGVGVGF